MKRQRRSLAGGASTRVGQHSVLARTKVNVETNGFAAPNAWTTTATSTAALALLQIRMLPRTSAGAEFHNLLASADVILHPFPFGGSKTAADGLALGTMKYLPFLKGVWLSLLSRSLRTHAANAARRRGEPPELEQQSNNCSARFAFAVKCKWPARGRTYLGIGSECPVVK